MKGHLTTNNNIWAKEDLIYTAGFIDGEGSVMIDHNFSLSLNVYNCDKAVLDWMINTFGGRIYPLCRNLAKHRPCWYWKLYGRYSLPFMKAIYPYIKVKKEHFRLAIEYIGTLRPLGGRIGYTLEEKQLRVYYRDKMMQLNKKGARVDDTLRS